jgi:hypothetical protein
VVVGVDERSVEVEQHGTPRVARHSVVLSLVFGESRMPDSARTYRA